ncbi:MAG: Omp28-related outer membrane protein [Tannerella sp.]|jgi:hypothetical protein|nr:Omp28-related outer membrane protein [Tannerella sp.]
MKQSKKVFCYFLWMIPVIWMLNGSCKPYADPQPDTEVKISANKTSIKANNKDIVNFRVTADGVEVTSAVTITLKGRTTPVDAMGFSTDSVASYTFYATYQEIKSNEIIIEAVDMEMMITADKQTIKADGKDVIVFTVKIDDVDVTSSASIIQKGSPDSTLTDSRFQTKIAGTHTFYATHNGKKSNEIQINASELLITLSVDKSSIKANNRDKAIFTVKADNENVTVEAIMMQKKTIEDRAIDGRNFSTDEAGIFTFYAIYAGKKSNEIKVEATYVELAFLRGYSIIQITSTNCPVCPQMTDEMRIIQNNSSLAEQIHVVAFHPNGKYCDSELAGALSQTAVNFVDVVKLNAPPLAIIDLYTGVYLYPTTTQRQLLEAIDKVTLTRDRVSLTGMSVKSEVNDRKIDFTVNVKTLKTDNYRFFAFVVEDGIVHRQVTSEKVWDPNYVHNNIATYQLTEGNPYLGVDLGTVTSGLETTHSFSINTTNFNTGRDVNLDHCRIVCYTLRSKDGSNYIIDNVTSCPVNGSVRYLYER